MSTREALQGLVAGLTDEQTTEVVDYVHWLTCDAESLSEYELAAVWQGEKEIANGEYVPARGAEPDAWYVSYEVRVAHQAAAYYYRLLDRRTQRAIVHRLSQAADDPHAIWVRPLSELRRSLHRPGRPAAPGLHYRR